MKLKLSIVVFVVGIATLITGIVFLILDFNKKPQISDGEFLVSARTWTLQDDTNCASSETVIEENDLAEINAETNCIPSVIWQFTEIGKGKLTTNGHINDYDFTWAIKDGKLLIETDWLYELEDTYDYTLDKENFVLTLLNDGKTYTLTSDKTE